MQTAIPVFDLSITQWILFVTCGILVGMSKTGLSGAGLMVVPIMAGIFGGKLSTGIVLPMLIFADVFSVTYYNRHANWRYIWLLLPWALTGILLGAVFGERVNDQQFKFSIAIVVFIGICLLIVQEIKKGTFRIPDNKLFAAILGLTGGFATMVGNASGPLMALYLLSMHLPKNIFIATGAWFFLIINCIKVPLHIFWWQTINQQTILSDLAVFPAIVIGVIIGIKLVKFLPEKAYRYFIIISTLAAAFLLI